MDLRDVKCPPNELGAPKKKFKDTFKAVTAIKEHFSPNPPPSTPIEQ